MEQPQKIISPSQLCLDLGAHFECAGNPDDPKWLHAYLDSGGVPTIGIGTTRYYNSDFSKVRMGDVIPKWQMYDLYNHDLNFAAQQADALTTDKVNQHQFDAIVDFIFHKGHTAYRDSQLRIVINYNPNNLSAIGPQWLRWRYDNKKVVPGLLRRAKAELYLYTYGQLKFQFADKDMVV